MCDMGPSIKDVGIFLAVFDTPLLHHVEILTLIYLTSTFLYLATSEFKTHPPPPPQIFRRLLWMAPIALYYCMGYVLLGNKSSRRVHDWLYIQMSHSKVC